MSFAILIYVLVNKFYFKSFEIINEYSDSEAESKALNAI